MATTTLTAVTIGGTEKRIAMAIVTLPGIRPYMFNASSVAITTTPAALLQMMYVRHRGQSTGFGIRSMQHLQLRCYGAGPGQAPCGLGDHTGISAPAVWYELLYVD